MNNNKIQNSFFIIALILLTMFNTSYSINRNLGKTNNNNASTGLGIFLQNAYQEYNTKIVETINNNSNNDSQFYNNMKQGYPNYYRFVIPN